MKVSLKEEMLNISTGKVNDNYLTDDIEQDYKIIDAYPNCKFIWVLRANGTACVPMKIGVDPLLIEYWFIDEVHKAAAYLIDPETESIKVLSDNQAIELVNLTPVSFSLCYTSGDVAEKVNAVLAFGLEKRIWGLFESVKLEPCASLWNAWLSYFEEHNNPVMIATLQQGIKKLSTLKDAELFQAA